ncbi:heterokaryon incompatibility protein-domain-containing protein [Nemania sp. FL0916]|nr:heterokaryon incompatibility protein-domain-containing protein [Nemania sp. FL0916]
MIHEHILNLLCYLWTSALLGISVFVLITKATATSVMDMLHASVGLNGSQTLKLGDREYWLMPVTGATTQQTRAQRSELELFDSEALKKLPEYEYKRLSGPQKKIRLLRLRSGTTHGSEIFCELIRADYGNSFHIPTTVDGQPKDREGVAKEPERKGDLVGNPTGESKKDQATSEFDPEWYKVQEKKIEYEALSWCWGLEPADYAVKIEENGKTYKLRVRKELALALKYLRLPEKTRTLWIDAICINQDDPEERNHQVQMMSRVYTRAKQVCIWLGENTDESKTAIDFIHQEIMEFKNFDAICSDKRYIEKWQALMMLMERDWFSRRWVVQEIALATRAHIYCGPDSLPWKEFAVAVELFVEVESASHRLSGIMQKDEKFRHIPNWFDHVSELGASLLVQATGKVPRAQRTPMQDYSAEILREDGLNKSEREGKKGQKELRQQMKKARTIDPLDRRSLLSLEYLVSTMFIFKATEPRDVVYSLLAIARDAAPFAYASNSRGKDKSFLVLSLLHPFLEEKPFVIDYNRPYPDVCRDFVEFCIHRKHKLDPVQALDILCRPWALDPQPGKSIRVKSDPQNPDGKTGLGLPKRKIPWKIRQAKYVEAKDGPEQETKRKWRIEYKDDWIEDSRPTSEYIKQIKDRTQWDQHREWVIPGGWDEIKSRYFPDKNYDSKDAKADPTAETDTDAATDSDATTDPGEETDSDASTEEKTESKPEAVASGTANGAIANRENELSKLPSWVNPASKAPFNLYHHAGQSIYKTGRAAADPLVGQPQDGHRNYSAAQTRPLDLRALKFRRRPQLGHYSLYVTGFKLDSVEIVKDASQGGNIPKAWLDLVAWEAPYSHDPPDEFWRTLVGDRGRDNRNPPYYYARACKKSVLKGGVASNSVNTSALIDHERNSIVAEFCRRVQSVIWGRRLYKTKEGTLGLAPDGVQVRDKVCILYGCTVPVILREYEKNEGDIENEEIEDRVEHLKSLIRKWEQNCVRRVSYPREDKEAKDKKEVQDKGDVDDKTGAHPSKKDEGKNENLGLDMNDTEGGKREEKKSLPMPGQLKRRITTFQVNRETAEKESPQRYYEFIGESYLHGMMDGEALRLRFYNGIADRVFELR